MRMHLLAGFALTSWTALTAQTFVVDASNGPGTNFTSLPSAVATVPDGATLVVRAGGYGGFALIGKGLTILCDPGVTIVGGIGVANTAVHQAVTLRGMTWSTPQTADTLIALYNCNGPVLLERILQPPQAFCLPTSSLSQCHRVAGLFAQLCAQLALHDCTLLCTAHVELCDTVIEGCQIEGEDGFQWLVNQPGRTALTAQHGRTQIAGNCLLRGGDGWPLGPFPSPAGDGIALFDGTLRLLDGQIFAGSNSVVPSFTVRTNGAVQLRIAPRVALVGNSGPQAGTDVMPQATGSSAPPGGTLTAAAETEDGDLVVLAVGIPGPAVLVPGIQDPFWLDPLVHVVVAVGVQQGGVPIGSSIAVPAGPAFVGLMLTWQAACYGPVTGLQATNPVVTLVY